MDCSMTVKKVKNLGTEPFTIKHVGKATCIADDKTGLGMARQNSVLYAIASWALVSNYGVLTDTGNTINTFIADPDIADDPTISIKADVCVTVEYIGDSLFPKYITINCKDILPEISANDPWYTISTRVRNELNKATGLLDFSEYPVNSASCYIHA